MVRARLASAPKRPAGPAAIGEALASGRCDAGQTLEVLDAVADAVFWRAVGARWTPEAAAAVEGVADRAFGDRRPPRHVAAPTPTRGALPASVLRARRMVSGALPPETARCVVGAAVAARVDEAPQLIDRLELRRPVLAPQLL